MKSDYSRTEMLQVDKMLATRSVRMISLLFVWSQLHHVHMDVKKLAVGLLRVAELHKFTCTGSI